MKNSIQLDKNLRIETIIDVFKDERYFFILESNRKGDLNNTCSYIGIRPHDYVLAEEGKDAIEKFNLFYQRYKQGGNDSFFPDFFCFMTYDLGLDFINVKSRFKYKSAIPKGFLGYYPVIIMIDENNNNKAICYKNDFLNMATEIKKKIEMHSSSGETKHISKYKMNYSEIYEDYEKKIDKIKNYIYEGDVYQINYTRRFAGTIEDISYDDMYKKLRSANPAPFSAYVRNNDWAIISSSPERLVRSKSGLLETRPIKGTIERGSNVLSDWINKIKLRNSEKDKSELLMIVDLERNDLSRVSENGSVKVEELFKIETYETVHHLVSTVTSRVARDKSPFDVLYRLFPGGSITGTPKKRAVEIIDELEEFSRGIYTGAIGYIMDNGDFDFNIAIRTIVAEGNDFCYNVGGGITWKSDSEAEFMETEHKGLGLKRSLEQ